MAVKISIGPQPPLKIWFGTVDHNNGTNTYFSRTKSGLEKQMADFCRDWWHDLDVPEEPPEEDAACINKYFELNMEEYVSTEEVEVLP